MELVLFLSLNRFKLIIANVDTSKAKCRIVEQYIRTENTSFFMIEYSEEVKILFTLVWRQ